MRLILMLLLLPSSALAHVGHLGELAGHDHIAIGVGIGVLIGAAVWGKLKGEAKAEDDGETREDEEFDGEEAPA